MERDGAKDTTAGAQSLLDRHHGLHTGPTETDLLNMAIPPSDRAAIFPDGFYGDMSNDDLIRAPQIPQP